MRKRAPIPVEKECRACGATMRLFGIEAHPAIGGIRLLTYVCPRCDHVQTQAAPAGRTARSVNGPAHDNAFDTETTRLLCAAFDAAWETVLASGTPLEDARQTAAVRELLAKHILEMAGSGERDPQQLVENALRLLPRSPSAEIEAG
jgi:hypothetical protein